VQALIAIAAVTVAVSAAVPASAATAGASHPVAVSAKATSSAPAHTAPRAGDTAGNPGCSAGAPLSFSGGTGLFSSNSFISDYATVPWTGAADVPNAHFTNIFLFPISPSIPSWDAYRKSLPKNQRPPKQEQLDALTGALTCSSYFDALTQYNINAPVFNGDEVTIPSCVNAALHDAMANNNVISFATMRTFAGCEQSNNINATDQVNIFVAPKISASSFGHDGSDMCPGITGYHGVGQGVPNWTVIPTTPVAPCNATPGTILESLSHEMVELISDPGGFGWLHTGNWYDLVNWFNFTEKLGQGELGDICSSVGEYPAPPVPFPDTDGFTGLEVAPYWSDQDGSCVPTSIMNDVLVPLAGSPSIRFTGSVHNLTIPITQSNPPPGTLDSLELDVVTGNDNLNSSSAANVIVQADVGGQTVTLQQNAVNEGAEWANNSLHEVQLQFPPGIPVSDITQVTLNTQFGGGVSGDNWDVAGVEIQAHVQKPGINTCPVASPTLLNVGGTGNLLMRFTGGQSEQLTESLTPVPSADQDLLVTGLYLTVGTGGDDLRGGNSPTDNANAIVNLSDGATTQFSNINGDADWPNGLTTPQINLLKLNSLPPGTTAGDLQSLEIQTDLPGGTFGDNWDLSSLQLFATLGCPSTSPPTTSTTTLVNDVGTATLPDGSIGLCRITGASTPVNCFPGNGLTIPPPSGFNPSDCVDSLQMTITTGADDLRGGGFPGYNADVSISGAGTFLNVNESDHWPNGSVNTFPLVLTSGVTLGSLTSLQVDTNFGGGYNGDNWDIADISLQATVTPGSGPSCTPPPGPGTAARAATGRAAPAAAASAAVMPGCPHTAGRSGACSRQPQASVQAAGAAPSPWSVLHSGDRGTGDNVLNGVTCVSLTDCFGVGYYTTTSGVQQPMIERWNGTIWGVLPTPTVGQYSMLNSVSCISATDCVAVGFDGSGAIEGSGGLTQALIETWNGAGWAVTVSANPPGAVVSVLNGVSCTSTGYCDAVGDQSGTGDSRTLVENLGRSANWTVQNSANPPGGNSELNSVSCTSPTHCVAVGGNDAPGVPQTLAETWNGHNWAPDPTPNVGGGGNTFYDMGLNVLNSVSCYSPADCVAVGAHITNSRAPQTLIEQTTNPASKAPWFIAPSVNPGSGGNVLTGVSCLTGPRCMAVGFDYNRTKDQTLNENWDGQKWFDTSTPSPGPASNFLTSDWCPSSQRCFAVGDTGPGAGVNQTLALAYAATPPNAPTAAKAVAGDSQAKVAFKAPTDNGGYPVTSYTVLATDATNPANGGQTASAASSPIVVPGLTNGDSYTFTVTATNAIGTGPASAPSNAIIPMPQRPSPR
jgi:hypothetical protein